MAFTTATVKSYVSKKIENVKSVIYYVVLVAKVGMNFALSFQDQCILELKLPYSHCIIQKKIIEYSRGHF